MPVNGALRMKKLTNIALFSLFVALSIWLGASRHQIRILKSRVASPIITRDTIMDTLKIITPIPDVSEIIIDNPVYIPVEKIVYVGDSIVVARERKMYQDSTYKAVISGYEPNLDYIEVYRRTTTNTIILNPENKVQLYYGLNASIGLNEQMSMLSAGLLVKTKKDFIAGMEYGYINIQKQWHPYIGGKLYWKISFRK